MKKCLLIGMIIVLCCLSATAQTVYNLDSCKAMALRGNLTVQNKRLLVESATEVKKGAFTKYFPSVSAAPALRSRQATRSFSYAKLYQTFR